MAADGTITVFRRIICDPNILDGRPHIKKHGGRIIPVDAIIDRLRRKRPFREIREEFGKMTDRDFVLCRAWQARFAPGTLSKEFSRAASPDNIIMLDENMDYGMLYHVVKLFGRSSHVTADGLYDENNDDEKCIWNHMIKHKYKAIVTADSDFTRISHRHRRNTIDKYGSVQEAPNHLPVVIHLMNDNHEKALNLLRKYQDDILTFIENPDAAYADLTDKGLVRYRTDGTIRCDLAAANLNRKVKGFIPPQIYPSSPPSSGPEP